MLNFLTAVERDTREEKKLKESKRKIDLTLKRTKPNWSCSLL